MDHSVCLWHHPAMINTSNTWQQELSDVVTSFQELADLLNLDVAHIAAGHDASRQFALRVPRPYLLRIQKGNLKDPLLLQVLPQAQEMSPMEGFNNDPLQESQHNPIPGLLHKYHNRVLLTLAASCAINCRYCFRRHFPYQDNVVGLEGLTPALHYIKENTNIDEIILSGGEPLLMKDNQLQKLFNNIAAIRHVTRVRIHTRLPIVIPSRVTDSLVKILTDTRLNVVVVVHCNHPNELDDQVGHSLQLLSDNNITMLNQSVLLRDVNDSADVLCQLSNALFSMGVLPYYLHMLDPVAGSAHFKVDESRAKIIYQQLQAMTSGYLVPKLVVEQPKKPNKILVTGLSSV